MKLYEKFLICFFLFVFTFIMVFADAPRTQTVLNPFTGKFDFINNLNQSGHNATFDFYKGDGSLLTNLLAGTNSSNSSLVSLQTNLTIALNNNVTLNQSIAGKISKSGDITNANVNFNFSKSNLTNLNTISFNGSQSHACYDNSTCLICTGSTSRFELC